MECMVKEFTLFQSSASQCLQKRNPSLLVGESVCQWGLFRDIEQQNLGVIKIIQPFSLRCS
jgi:hypothetical protein